MNLYLTWQKIGKGMTITWIRYGWLPNWKRLTIHIHQVSVIPLCIIISCNSMYLMLNTELYNISIMFDINWSISIWRFGVELFFFYIMFIGFYVSYTYKEQRAKESETFQADSIKSYFRFGVHGQNSCINTNSINKSKILKQSMINMMSSITYV